MNSREPQLSMEEAAGMMVEAARDVSPEFNEAFADRLEYLANRAPVTEEEAAQTHLALLVMDAIAAEAERGYDGWSTYALGRVGEGRPFYIGMSTRPQARLHQHMHMARSDTARYDHPLARAVFEAMEPHGPGVWLKIIAEGLTTEEARAAEASMIRQLLGQGVPLLNQITYEHRGETPAEKSRRRMQDPAYRELNRRLNREHQREQYAADSGYRLRARARGILCALRKGGSLTARREAVLKAAGRDYWPRAQAILAGREDA